MVLDARRGHGLEGGQADGQVDGRGGDAPVPATLQDLVSDKYLRAIPEDPFTHSVDTWREVPSEPDPNNPTAQPGVYDVKSGSDLTALDGTKYSEWD